MAQLSVHFTSEQVTYQQPPPAGSVSEAIPNQTLQNVVFVLSSELDNPGTVPPATPDSFPRVADVYSVNPNLSQFFPINAPPAP